jgi:outer membrane immunogenic protein
MWGRSQHVNDNPRSPAYDLVQTNGIHPDGGTVGGTIGCDYQFAGNWVAGVENDLSWVSASGGAPSIPPFVPGEVFATEQDWLDTLRARIGYAQDRWFLYGTGGAAFGDVHAHPCDPVAGCVSATKDATGWVAGVGVEYALLDHLSLKLEYLHADFGSMRFPALITPALFANGSNFFAPRRVSLSDDIVRIGVNYRFDLFGPSARL